MILLDSNVYIYLANGTLPAKSIKGATIAHSVISEIEVLGYHKITAQELILLQTLLEESITLAVDKRVTAAAIKNRQRQNMSLGDAVVAATAQVHQIPLWTVNTKDFEHVEELGLVNPLEQ